jgi:hypothetical protein
MISRRMTPEEHAQGFVVCSCGKYAHVFRAAVVAKLPHGYRGELCQECSLWVCSVAKLREAGLDVSVSVVNQLCSEAKQAEEET